MKFQELHEQTYQIYLNYKKKSNMIAFMRFFTLVGSVFLLLIGYFQQMFFLYTIAALLLISFMILVMYHERVFFQVQYYQSIATIYHEHELRSQNQFDSFLEDGREFIELNPEFSLDLDVFGKHSLFQKINLAFTHRGKSRLANLLISPDCSQIKQRQEAVKELADNPEFVIDLQTYGRMIPQKSQSIEKFIQSSYNHKMKFSSLYYMLPFMTVLSLICSLLHVLTPYSYAICEAGFVLQLVLSFVCMKKHSALFEPITLFHEGLKSYKHVFKRISTTSFHSPLLRDIHKRLFESGNVLEGIEELSRLSQRISYRHNIFAYILLNGLLSFDIVVSASYQRWLLKYYHLIEGWFDQLAMIEALMSLSVLAIDEEQVTLPQMQEELGLSCNNIRHPLLDHNKVVGNDYIMKKQVQIITGSNMSGKTTFMRAIALNLVLAYAGGYVYADEMSCSFMHIMTSMRVKDNVEEGISTFYGELLRIKQMIQYSYEHQPMICFIDEIFKGTNSLDRIAGAKATIQKLSLPYCVIFLTTHDFELCRIDDVDTQNYHFDESYEDEHIYFDYKMKDGPSTSTNGQFLLQQLGIIGGD